MGVFMYKTILLSFLVLLTSGCRKYNQTTEEMNCLEPQNKFHESYYAGIAKATMTFSNVYSSSVFLENWSLESSDPKSSCIVKECNEGYILLGGDSQMCVPKPTDCQFITIADNMSLVLNSLSESFIYNIKDTVECQPVKQLECAADESINEGPTPSCVKTVIECSIDEITEGVLSGIKTFLPAESSYGSCQIEACSEGYRLESNVCIQNPPSVVIGCMDSRADNYNPIAVESDMSCTCSGNIIYNPVTGCTESMQIPF